jgi:hypothetical protein
VKKIFLLIFASIMTINFSQACEEGGGFAFKRNVLPLNTGKLNCYFATATIGTLYTFGSASAVYCATNGIGGRFSENPDPFIANIALGALGLSALVTYCAIKGFIKNYPRD